MYGADISSGLVSQVTNSVIEKVIAWQNRPLNPSYSDIWCMGGVLKMAYPVDLSWKITINSKEIRHD
jgi:transposase-like protein